MPPDFFGTGWTGKLISWVAIVIIWGYIGAARLFHSAHAERLMLRMDPDAKPILYGASRSGKWPRVRAEHLEREPRCAACGGTEDLEVHHKKPEHLFPELELEPSNLITLCQKPSRSCHFSKGHSFNWKAYNPHVVEDAALSMQRILQRKLA